MTKQPTQPSNTRTHIEEHRASVRRNAPPVSAFLIGYTIFAWIILVVLIVWGLSA